MNLRAYWTLIRPWNGLLVFFCVFGGYHLSESLSLSVLFSYKLTLMAVITFVVTSAANMINDYFDLSVDKINRPERPLPLNKINPENVLLVSVFLFFLSLFLSLLFHFYIQLIVFIAILISFYYTPVLKKMGLIKNLSISLNVFFSFLCGGLLTDNVMAVIPIACFSFLLITYREIIKDLYDYEGDKKNNIRTLTVVWGLKKAWWFAFSSLLVLICSLICSFLFYNQSFRVLFFLLFFVLIPLLVCSIIINIKNFERSLLRKTLTISKILMFVGLFIFILLKN